LNHILRLLDFLKELQLFHLCKLCFEELSGVHLGKEGKAVEKVILVAFSPLAKFERLVDAVCD